MGLRTRVAAAHRRVHAQAIDHRGALERPALASDNSPKQLAFGLQVETHEAAAARGRRGLLRADGDWASHAGQQPAVEGRHRESPRAQGVERKRTRRGRFVHRVAIDHRRRFVPERPTVGQPHGGNLLRAVEKQAISRDQRKAARRVRKRQQPVRAASRQGVLRQRNLPGDLRDVDGSRGDFVAHPVAGEGGPIGRGRRTRPRDALGGQLAQGLGEVHLATAQAASRAGCRRTNAANSSRAARRRLPKSRPTRAARGPWPGRALCPGSRARSAAGPAARRRAGFVPSIRGRRRNRPIRGQFHPRPAAPCRRNCWRRPARRHFPRASGLAATRLPRTISTPPDRPGRDRVSTPRRAATPVAIGSSRRWGRSDAP